jgi:hypothetical protein
MREDGIDLRLAGCGSELAISPQRTQRSLTAATKGITPATATTTASRDTVENLRGLRRNATLVVQSLTGKKEGWAPVWSKPSRPFRPLGSLCSPKVSRNRRSLIGRSNDSDHLHGRKPFLRRFMDTSSVVEKLASYALDRASRNAG